ncbi:MAG TPA: IPTL-CTERM sorting domain-containing protein [Thermoanaerobaculia bacterium]|nr:IPTL-CTERM sorting domain-containing protein [Thermoanaerobaculia bacterium]
MRWAWATSLVLAQLCGMAAAPPAGAQVIVGRGFGQSFVSFQDVNGNGVLDCGEPVTLRATYLDPSSDTATGSISGQLAAPAAGTVGLAFIPGSVEIDAATSTGCVPRIVSGNQPGDTGATVSFSCGPPRQGSAGSGQQSNVVAVLYRAAFSGSSASFTAVMHGTTSDGLDVAPQLVESSMVGAACPAGGAPPSVTVTKTAAGTGIPGSTLLFTIVAADQSGLGLGGLQLTDVVPLDAVFDAAASSPGWVCPSSAAGSLCRLPAGNLAANGTVTRFFAVDLVPALPAGVSAISNTACARSGPATVVGCGSVSAPTAGQVVLTLVKSLGSGTGAPGGTVVYGLTATNSGTQDSGPVTIAETVPANTTWTPGGGWSCSGSGAGAACSLAVGNVPAGGSVAVAPFSVVVTNPLPAGAGSIANTACASAAGGSGGAGGPGGPPSCSTVTIPTTGAALLAVSKTVAGTGAPGSNLIYSITVQNTGNQGAAGVTVSEAVPALTSFVAAGSSPAWSCAGTGAGASCSAAIASLPAGGSAVLTFVAAVESPLPAGAGAIGNQACAAASGLAAVCAATSTPTTGQPNLRLVKSYGGGAVRPGAVLPFQLTVSNTGNQDLGAAVVSETVPALSSFDAGASDGRWSCAGVAAGSSCTLELSGVAAGTSQAIVFAVRAAASLPAAAAIANAACVTGVSALPEAAARTLRLALRRGERPAAVAAPQACGSVTTPVALAIDTTLAAAVVDHAAPALPGDRIHYTLTVPNATGATLTALAAVAALDPNTVLVSGSVSATQGTVTAGDGMGDTAVAVALGDLAAGGTATVEWDVTVAAHLPPGLTEVAAQVATSGANIPTDESGPPPAPSTPGPTTTPVVAAMVPPPPPPHGIPALGPWGLGAMTVLLGGVAAGVLRRRGAAPGGAGAAGLGR